MMLEEQSRFPYGELISLQCDWFCILIGTQKLFSRIWESVIAKLRPIHKMVKIDKFGVWCMHVGCIYQLSR